MADLAALCQTAAARIAAVRALGLPGAAGGPAYYAEWLKAADHAIAAARAALLHVEAAGPESWAAARIAPDTLGQLRIGLTGLEALVDGVWHLTRQGARPRRDRRDRE
jgi:hypothetical protein